MWTWLFVIFVLVGAHAAEVGDTCLTPANKPGECRRLQDCPALIARPGPDSQRERRPMTTAGKLPIRDSVKACPLAPAESNPGVCCERDVSWTNDPQCGIRYVSRPSGGFGRGVGYYPWIALLGYNDTAGFTRWCSPFGSADHTEDRVEFNCGGSLINSRWVLTAAHCVTNSLTTVRLGEHDLTRSPDCTSPGGAGFCHPEHLDVSVRRTVRHPEFTRNVVDNDIALVELAATVQYRDEIKPVCLPVREIGKLNLERKMITVAGWRRTQESGRFLLRIEEMGAERPRESRARSVLKALYVPVTTDAACNEAYPTRTRDNDSISSKNTMCVGGGELPWDSCNGDSGGPLTMSAPMDGYRRWVQFGVATFGRFKCGNLGMPAVHTRVSEYIQWINSVVDG